MPISQNFLESEASFQNRQQQSDARELAIREAIESAARSGDATAELEAREQLEAFKYASQSVSDPRVETALQGATFGLADEVSAGLNTIPGWLQAKAQGSPASFGDIYEQNVAPIRESVNQYRDENLGKSLGYDVAGGLLTGAGAYKALTKGVPALLRMSSLPRLALTGGAFGAASGAGRADGDLEDRLKGGAVGAGLGAVAGAGLGLLGNLANNYIIQPAMRAIRSPQNAAQKAVMETLADEGLTATQAGQRLKDLGQQGMIADLGTNTRALAGSVSRISGQAGAAAEKTLQGRVEGGAGRLRSALRSILGNNKDAIQEFAAIDSSRRAQAGPLYQKAHQELIQLDDELLPLVKKAGSGVYSKAMRIFNTDPDAPPVIWPAFNDLKQGKSVPLAVVDYMKRALSGAARSVGGNKEMSGVQGKLAERLTETLNKRSDTYNQARQIYADQSRLLDALKTGQNVLKDSPDDIAATLGKLNQAEQDAYRLGMIKAVETQLKNVNIGSDASRKVIRTELLKDRLRAAFPDDDSLNAFVNAAERENTFAATRNEVLRGSQTRARQISDAKLVTRQAQAISQDLMDGNIGTAARKVISAMSKSKELGDEELASQIGEIIFAQGDDAMRLLTQAQKTASSERFKRVLAMVKTLPADITTTSSNEAGLAASRL